MASSLWKKFIVLAGLGMLATGGCAGGASAGAPAPVFAVGHLRCEDRADPLGVDLAQPRLSWQVQSTERGAVQTAYEVLAASSPELLASGEGDLWDSGKVMSDETLGIGYAGKPLASAQLVYWKVRSWDGEGQASAWSPMATWTMGVMNDADWKAQWVGAPAGLTASTLVLRHEFTVRPGLRRATVNVCGLGQYEMSFNGQKVSDDLLAPGWTVYNKTCLYDTYDVTAMLQAGPNAVGLLLANGMYNNVGGGGRYTKFKGSFGPLQAIVQLRLEYADGTVEVVGTNETWHVAAGPITFSGVYGGEDYDARLEPKNWKQPGFDESGWRTVAVLEGPGGKLRGLSCAAPPIREFEVLTPVKITELRPGVKVYDLGQNAALMPRITVSGPAGARVRITPAELLHADGSVDRGSVGGGQAYWQYTLGGNGEESWFPKFFYQGARYLQVECVGPEGGGQPVVESLEGAVVHSACPPAGEFACSNDLFNRIYTLILWAQRSNLMSVITDCPHRERLGWLEQDYLNGPSLRYDFDLAPLVNKVLNDMTDSQLESGLVPSIAPEYTKFTDRKTPPGGRNAFGDSPEWGSALVQCAWQQYQWTGDSECLQRYYAPMQRYVAYLQSRAKDGIINYGLGDWYDLGPKRPGVAQLTPLALTATAIYYSDIVILEQAAQVLGKDDDALNYAKQAAEVRTAFNQALFHADTGFYATGSQTADAMPLTLGLVEPEQAPRVLDALVADVRKHGNGLTSGDVGYAYLLRALEENGRSDVIFDINNQSDKPGYGYQLKMGATSLT
ncbi:MAG: family 78 glycoside hydrolase catalytic domain, partial [Opitutales bacterium]